MSGVAWLSQTVIAVRIYDFISAGTYSMQPEDNTDSSLVAELAKADGQVREMVASVDRQRQLIWDLAEAGSDVSSAQIVLDSLLISIFCG